LLLLILVNQSDSFSILHFLGLQINILDCHKISVSSRTYMRDLIKYQHFLRSLPSVEITCCSQYYQHLTRF